MTQSCKSDTPPPPRHSHPANSSNQPQPIPLSSSGSASDSPTAPATRTHSTPAEPRAATHGTRNRTHNDPIGKSPRSYLCAAYQAKSIQSQMSMVEGGERRKRAATIMPSAEQWYDVQDDNGTWRVGFCEKNDPKFKLISLDGFHPNHSSFYCDHAGKILPIRTKTMGITAPEQKTIRREVKLKEIEQVCGKLSLFQLITNQLDSSPQKIRVFIRTELLIFVDKIFHTPFEILANIKMIDVHINKLFMHTSEYYFKLLQNSKRFVHLLDSNPVAVELLKATYEMAIVMELILGVHKRSRAFYDCPTNRTIKCQAMMDYFIKYQGGGILPFKLFFKNLSLIKTVQKQDLVILLQTVYLFISLCEKYQSQFIEGKIQSLTRIIIEEIINLIKVLSGKKPQIAAEIKTKIQLISRIQTLHFKLFPNKECDLRRFIEGEKPKEHIKMKQIEVLRSMTRMRSDLNVSFKREFKGIEKQKQKQKQKDSQRLQQLQSKINRLEATISKLQVVNLHNQNVNVTKQQKAPQGNQPKQNLGEQAFLASLQWALDAGDIATSLKLVQWRKSLLRLGRITGWEIALSVGMKTFKKKLITPEDIIQANYQFIKNKE